MLRFTYKNLKSHLKYETKNIRHLVFNFSPINLAFWFFLWFARFQILLRKPQSIWRKVLGLYNKVYTWHLSDASEVMKLMNSETHSCTHSRASFAIFPCEGMAFFIILATLAVKKNIIGYTFINNFKSLYYYGHLWGYGYLSFFFILSVCWGEQYCLNN